MTAGRAGSSSAERVYDVSIDGTSRVVGIERRDGEYYVRVDGLQRHVDLAYSDRSTLSLRFPDEHGRVLEVRFVEEGDTPEWTLHLDGRTIRVRVNAVESHRGGRAARRGAASGGSGCVTAPMPGKVVRLLVAPGDSVAAHQAVAIVEAMKMENELRASRGGVVRDVLVREGASVEAGTPLVLIE